MPDYNWQDDELEPAQPPRPIVPNDHPIARMVESLRRAKAATWMRFCLSDHEKAQCPCCLGRGTVNILRRAA